MTNIAESRSNTNHQEWLKEVAGQAVSEIYQARAMEGFSDIDLTSLVVADFDLPWDKVKQSLIPLGLSKDQETAGRTASKLKMLRAELMSQDAFFVLVKDEQMGGKDNWALSMINPKDLSNNPDKIKSGMEISYYTGQKVLGSSSRAAFLAVTGKESI